MKGNMRELLLLGDLQCGKSTTFNAICDGREISPRGVGIRTTGCPISVQSISANEDEYAELVWKTDDELMLVMYDLVSGNLVDDWNGRALFPFKRPEKLPSLSDAYVRGFAQKAVHSEWERYRANPSYVTDINRLWIATLILRFYGTLKLDELRARTKVAPDDVKSLAVFPPDWGLRWQKDGEEAYWSLKKVAFAFLSKIVCHIHSQALERLGCVVTDCPSPYAGALEAECARRTMEKADAILYVLNGHKNLFESEMHNLSQMREIGLAHKFIFAINARSAKANIERNLRPVDFACLRNAGFPIEREEDIPVFNSLLAFNAKTTPSDSFAWRKETHSALSMYLGLEPFDDDDRDQILKLSQDKAGLYKASGLEAVLDEVEDRLSAGDCTQGRHLEIALVGEYQNGKSTIFNAMLGGRDLSSRGVNAKRSACTITACALPRDQEEYAEFEWRSEAMLDEIVAIGGASDGVGDEDVARLAKLVSRFRNCPELARLRKTERMPIKEAQRLLVYPVDWEPRWMQDGGGGTFKFDQIAWVFIGRVKYHVHSRLLTRLGCDLTDSPGFGAGEWDEALARAAILRADVLVCVLDKSKAMTSASPYVKRLRWTREVGKENSIVYALNSEKSRETAGEWQKVNVSTLETNGFEVDEWQAPVFNAELGRYAAKMRSANDDASRKNILRNACPVMGKWLEAGSEDRAMVKELCRDSRRMSREAGFDGFLDAVRRAVSDFREKERDGRLRVSPLGVGEDGAPVAENGFAWVDDSSFISRLMKGCRWKAGIPHAICPHVVSDEKERVWRPAPGYVYVNGRRDEFRVKWKPGLSHPDCPNVVSSKRSGTWSPAPGYAWVDETSWTTKWKKGVKWKADLRHPAVEHAFSHEEEGTWCADPGYIWRKKGDVLAGVRWKSGQKHPVVPHIVSRSKEGYWIPEEGYGWRLLSNRDERKAEDVHEGCKWQPYKDHPCLRHVCTTGTEGVWSTDPGYVFSESGSRESTDPWQKVVWQPGYERYDGKVAGDEEGVWENKWWYLLRH